MAAAGAAALMVWACERPPDSPIVARVGRSVLTLDDLNKRIPPEYSDGITRRQMLEYVKQWVDTELLYQEGLRQRIQREPLIRERLEKMRKDLIGAEMISRSSLGGGDFQISDDQIRAYYEQHRESFQRESDAIRYIEIVVDDLKTAWDVRNVVTTDNFLDLAVRFSRAPVQDPRSVPFVAVDDLPPEIASVAMTIKVKGTTAPIKLADGYHIVRVLDKQMAGTYHLLAEVRDEILNVLATDAHKQGLDRLLSDLRLKTDYELNLDLIPKPTSDAATTEDTLATGEHIEE